MTDPFDSVLDRMHWRLDDQGEPVSVPIEDFDAWAEWMHHTERHVADDYIGGERISTIFLGMNQCLWEKDKPPVLWETMVLGGIFDGYQMRYRNRADAERGHADALAMVALYRLAPRRIRKSVRKYRLGHRAPTKHTRGDILRVVRFTRRLAREHSGGA